MYTTAEQDLAQAIATARAERNAVIAEAAAEGITLPAGIISADRLRERLAILREARDYTPQVGDGMSLQYPQDCYPLVVTRVSPSGKTVWVKPLREVSLATGHEPARYDGPFPVWSHDYTAEERQSMIREDAPEQRVTRSRDGMSWSASGTPVLRGATYHRNYSY